MAQLPMYPAQINSPVTSLAVACSNSDTTLQLVDASKLPAGTNLCTIGKGETAETVLYTGKSGNNLTGVTRGYQSTALAWGLGAEVARYLTAYDVDTMKSNIEDLVTAKEPAIVTKLTAFNKNYGVTATDVKINGNQGVGSVDAIARIDHIHPTEIPTKTSNAGKVLTVSVDESSLEWGSVASDSSAFMSRQAIIDGNFQIAQLGYPTASVAFTDTGDLVTLNAHGMVNGETVTFLVITTTTGITVGTTYYVISATTNTFQVSLTSGGAAVALTTNGTGVVQYSYALNPASTSYPVFDLWRTQSSGSSQPLKIKHKNRKLINGELPLSSNCFNVNVDSAGTYTAPDYNIFMHYIEKGTELLAGLGNKVTLSFCARSSIVDKKIGIYTSQIYGTGGTSTETIGGGNFTLTSAWQKFTHIITLNTLNGKIIQDDNALGINFALAWGTTLAPYVNSTGVAETFRGAGDIEIAQVQLCAGEVALPFMPKTFDEELRACQRYYEKSYNYTDYVGKANVYAGGIYKPAIVAVAANTAGLVHPSISYKVKKRNNATPAIYALSGAVNAVTIDGGSNNRVGVTATNSNSENGILLLSIDNSGSVAIQTTSYIIFQWTADARF